MMMYIAMAIVSQWTSTEAAFRVNTAGNGGTCALNDGEGLKCWGRNDYGQLGIGHSNNVEKPLNVTIDLGTDFVPREVGCGGYHCCSVSTTDLLKCWGLNEDGQLGYGDNSTRGDEEGEMGDNLDAVQLPDGFVIAQLVPTSKSTCVKSTEGEIVCFGLNDYDQCGVGHNSNIGDDVNQMGDYLVAVDLEMTKTTA
jgi:alpha-tubulin suppressor-like RCC1 family protein